MRVTTVLCLKIADAHVWQVHREGKLQRHKKDRNTTYRGSCSFLQGEDRSRRSLPKLQTKLCIRNPWGLKTTYSRYLNPAVVTHRDAVSVSTGYACVFGEEERMLFLQVGFDGQWPKAVNVGIPYQVWRCTCDILYNWIKSFQIFLPIDSFVKSLTL